VIHHLSPRRKRWGLAALAAAALGTPLIATASTPATGAEPTNPTIDLVAPAAITAYTYGGSLYSVAQISALSAVARTKHLKVHLDGARLANAIARLGCTPAELTWQAGIDVLSFGATKNGAMTADAIVVFDRALTPELSFRAKRAGQLTSKMRFQSAQLGAYLTDGLWLRNAVHANTMAERLGTGLKAIPGTDLLHAVEANILFCRLPQTVIDQLLAEGFTFYHDRWEPGVCRFVTSFSTTEHDVDTLLEAVRRLAL
jgi:threonine aldolase